MTELVEGQLAYILNGHRNGVKSVIVSDISEERIVALRGGQTFAFNPTTREALSNTEWKSHAPVLVTGDEPRVQEILRRVEYRQFVGNLQTLAHAYAADPAPKLMADMRSLLNRWEEASEARENVHDTIATALERLGLPDPYRPREEVSLQAPRV